MSSKLIQTGLLLAGCFFLFSCQKEKAVDPIAQEGGLYILNEGNFNWGNASVSWVKRDGTGLISDLFQATNGFLAGDVAQDLVFMGDTAFLVMNNSAKVIPCTLPLLKAQPAINTGGSPRYMAVGENGLAVVTDLYGNKLHVLNVHEGRKTGEMQVWGWTEHVAFDGNGFVVCQRTAPFSSVPAHALLWVSTDGMNLRDSVQLRQEPVQMILYNQTEPVVLLRADTSLNDRSMLIRITGESRWDTLHVFESDSRPALLSEAAGKLYWLDRGKVYQWENGTVSPVLSLSGLSIPYAMGIDQRSGDIWIADALDYVRSSRVLVYSAQGSLKFELSAGMISNKFMFR
jgi:hypothetical protein